MILNNYEAATNQTGILHLNNNLLNLLLLDPDPSSSRCALTSLRNSWVSPRRQMLCEIAEETHFYMGGYLISHMGV